MAERVEPVLAPALVRTARPSIHHRLQGGATGQQHARATATVNDATAERHQRPSPVRADR